MQRGGGAALFRGCKRHFNTFGQSACGGGLDFEHEDVETLANHPSPQFMPNFLEFFYKAVFIEEA